ncbi:hypothetical protein Peur_004586 [Populus x canadensis]
MKMSGSPAPSHHCPSSGGRIDGSAGSSRAIPSSLDHHVVRHGEVKTSGSRLCSNLAATSPLPV